MAETRHRILVVDDSEMNLDLLQRRLTRKGYDVVTAETGPEALGILEQGPIDLVILDVMMPGMTGIEVLRAIRAKRSPHVLPVIIATAKSETNDLVAALDQGANDYVTKPIEIDVLLARMRAHLRRRTPRPSSRPSVAPHLVGIGVLIDQKYRLDAILGRGGFGTVYRARHMALSRDVAVKILHPDLLQSGDIVRRFQQEGVSACRVRHPNAVAILDAGTTREGVPYLVMELLEGRPLSDELREHGALRLSRCAEIIDPVCNALREAHTSGIIHRDIKPANILLSRGPGGEEIVKVLDFGIAKLLESSGSAVNTLTDGAGTPCYMAPERLLGEPADASADVYSVGVTLFEMLSGALPFPKVTGTPVQQAVQQLHAAATSLLTIRPDLPHELARMVTASMARDRNERPTLDALQEAVDDWSQRFVEREWPVPELGAYLKSQRPPPPPDSSGAQGDSPTRIDVPAVPAPPEESGTIAAGGEILGEGSTPPPSAKGQGR